MFADDRRKKINLGGVSHASTHAEILDKARIRRLERLEQKRRVDGALKMQKWWRFVQETRNLKLNLHHAFENDIYGIDGLRCLVLIGKWDKRPIAMWCSKVVENGPASLFSLAKSYPESWPILIRQICHFIIQLVADTPLSSESLASLTVLNMLLSPFVSSEQLGDNGAHIVHDTVHYLVSKNVYSFISAAITKIPVDCRSSPNLASIVSLSAAPFQFLEESVPAYAISLNLFFSCILTIPLLPNRLSPQSLTALSSQVPFSKLHLIHMDGLLNTITIADKVHLLSTLQVFMPPRYKLFSPENITIYFRLLTSLLNAIPVQTLNPNYKSDDLLADSDSDVDPDDHLPIVNVVSTFARTSRFIPLPDSRTQKRIYSIQSPSHVASILFHSRKSMLALIPLLFALSTIWPDVLGSILASSSGLLRELYRLYVRSSFLGREGTDLRVLTDPSNAEAWAPLLLLVDLYTKALMTMGDDEFFGTSESSASTKQQYTLSNLDGVGGTRVSLPNINVGAVSAWKNPLSLDELVSFIRQLLNIVFVLYLQEGFYGTEGKSLLVSMVGSVRCTWEGVREKMMRCLVGIHARDSRNPFVPQDHWLITSKIDMHSFVEAAIYEEREISSSASFSFRESKRNNTYLSPRLAVLNNIPFAIPFDVRVAIFRNFILNDLNTIAPSASHFIGGNPFAIINRLRHGSGRTLVTVRRENVAQDGFDKLGEADLKAPIEITFVDQFGLEERGIDGGGVFKEFFTSLCKEVFDTDRGLWLANKKNELYPNPHSYATEKHSLNWYRFIGRILGKAMYEGILVDVAFAGFFLAKWLDRQSFLDDLASLDPDLYNGLVFLKHYTGNMEDLALNFTVVTEEFGEARSIDLIPNGNNIAVVRENRLLYIQLVSHYRLSRQIKLQSEAFFEGLSEIIDRKWIRMFNQQEIQILLGGVNAPIDLDDLRENTIYGGRYDDQEPTMVTFWKVLTSFNQEQRMAFLRFVTSCSRPPLLGFKELVPKFCIRDAGENQERLPTSSTCINLLKLPVFKTEKALREKLLLAINANAGFDLS